MSMSDSWKSLVTFYVVVSVAALSCFILLWAYATGYMLIDFWHIKVNNWQIHVARGFSGLCLLVLLFLIAVVFEPKTM